MSDGKGTNCDGCRNSLGGGCCRINLEKECAAGGFEAWEPRKETSGRAVTVHEIMVTVGVPRHILDAALKDAGVHRLSGGGRTVCTYDVNDVRQALEKYYAKRIDWLRGKCSKDCRPWQERQNALKELEAIQR